MLEQGGATTVICVVGSSNFDIVVKVKRFTLPGEKQKAESIEFIPGGKGANQALTVSKLSGKGVFFLTCIGNDYFGNSLKEIFDRHGVIGYIQTEGTNGLALVEVDETGGNRIVIYSGANSELTVDLLEEHKEVFNNIDISLAK